MQPVKSVAAGNVASIGLLEKWLDHARKGTMTAVGIVVSDNQLGIAWDRAGVSVDEFKLYFGTDMLKNFIVEGVKRREPPLDDRIETADCVHYNLASSPHSFDFLTWLVDQEMVRIREGAPAPLKVYFFNRPQTKTPQTDQMLYNVLKPMLALIGAKEVGPERMGRTSTFYTCRQITDAVLAGEQVPRLKPSVFAVDVMKKYRGVVTITLREAEHWPHRNSNLSEWLKFADYIQAQGERVVIVRDTAKAHQELEGYEIVPDAALEVDLRMALYEGAKCNLFVGNGPAQMALFGTAPFLIFELMDERDDFPAKRPGWWKEYMGIEVGEQFPWQLPHQKFIWVTDDFEIMRPHWDQLRDELALIREAA